MDYKHFSRVVVLLKRSLSTQIIRLFNDFKVANL